MDFKRDPVGPQRRAETTNLGYSVPAGVPAGINAGADGQHHSQACGDEAGKGVWHPLARVKVH
jgi:hypothetical protein